MADVIDIALKGSAGGFGLDAALTVPAQGVTAIWGPSGTGKTTFLRAVAGLIRMNGHVRIGDDAWQDGRIFRPVHRRRVGYVFQEPSLLPHLSVQGNLDYALRRNGGAEVDRAAILDTLRLAPMMGRDPAQLSGGERQRVALARALFSAPRLLLMDEPLSSLDGGAKAEILPMIAALKTVPILYVSHDAGEVAALADRALRMDNGRLSADDAPPLDSLSEADIRALAAAALRAGLRP